MYRSGKCTSGICGIMRKHSYVRSRTQLNKFNACVVGSVVMYSTALFAHAQTFAAQRTAYCEISPLSLIEIVLLYCSTFKILFQCVDVLVIVVFLLTNLCQ